MREGNEDHLLFNAITEGCCRSFSLLFNKYYQPLCHFAHRFVGSEEIAKELVADIFLRLWHKRTSISITAQVKGYLYTATRNHAINFIKKDREHARSNFQLPTELTCHNASPLDTLVLSELCSQIEQATDALPTQRRLIFRLSHLGGFTRQEIGQLLNISDKTVGNQLGIAMKYLQRSQSWH